MVGENFLMGLANDAANRVFGAVALGATGLVAGVVGGGALGFAAGASKDPCNAAQMLYTIGGAYLGGYIGTNAAAIGAVIGIDGVIDIAKTPFVCIFNAMGAGANLATSAVSGAANLATEAVSAAGNAAVDFVSQHQVAIVATAVSGVAYAAYSQLSEEQKGQLADYAMSFVKPKEAEKLKESLAKEADKLKDHFTKLEDLLEGSETQRSALNIEILKEFINGKIEIAKVLELTKAYEAAVKDLPTHKIKEVTEASLALIESVGKYNGIREALYPEKALEQAKKAGASLQASHQYPSVPTSHEKTVKKEHVL